MVDLLATEKSLQSPSVETRSTGLVREITPADQLIFNLFMLNLGLAGVYIFEFGPFARPQANLYLSTLAAGIGFSAVGAVYALLSNAIPRTGGDYVFNTRILGPTLGFLGSWINFVVFTTIGCASVAWFWAHSGIPFALTGLARALGDHPWLELRGWLATPRGETLAATFLIFASALILIRGLSTLMKIQRWLFTLGVAGMLVSAALLLVCSNEQFQSRFDAAAGPGAYDRIIAAAKSARPIAEGWDWTSTLSLFPMFAVPAVFAVTTNWVAGELKQIQSPHKSLLTMTGAIVILMVITWGLNYALRRSVGGQFLAAITYLHFTGSSDYPFPSDPNYFHLASLLTDSPGLTCLMGLGWLAWCTMWTPGNIIFAVRLLFSWSVDGLVPAPLARVSPRWHSPITATIVVACLAETFLLVSRFGNMYSFFVAASFMVNVAMTLTCFSAILFPYRLKTLYFASRVHWSLGGVPVVSIVGVLGAVTMLVADVQFLAVSEFSVARLAPMSYAVGSSVAGILVFCGLRSWRKSQGLDLRTVFTAIPHE